MKFIEGSKPKNENSKNSNLKISVLPSSSYLSSTIFILAAHLYHFFYDFINNGEGVRIQWKWWKKDRKMMEEPKNLNLKFSTSRFLILVPLRISFLGFGPSHYMTHHPVCHRKKICEECDKGNVNEGANAEEEGPQKHVYTATMQLLMVDRRRNRNGCAARCLQNKEELQVASTSLKLMVVFDCGHPHSVDGLVMTVVVMKFAL
ncbi:transmembrane protein, putative [Medicago truncatula]|uniref:Transmembrane protein, putative n=1 Tax=Medicago truncatula TaxID=3880 RepID=A0A072V7H3_MEDTR|nr:transmembrane protein, putative [Medicago truncatula]